MSEPLTITDAAKLIKSGELTPSELLEQCLRRVDIYEHAVKAWVYLDRERARQEAAKFTDEIKKGHYRGPLHGIPIGIKDIIDVFDMPTGCGSKLWANSYARRDATCVSRLRDAGAVIMGKTVTTPFAYLDPPVTRNPWNLDRTPGGSSSGSAAAVACAMCLGALGTQTGGSLTRPASYCGVCSFKPWKDNISEEGVLPLATSLDHIGIMSRCITDLEFIYLVLTDTRDEHLGKCDNLDSAPEICVELVFDKPRPMWSSFSITRDFFFDDLNEHELGLFREVMVRTIKAANEETSIYETTLPAGFSQINTFQRIIMSTEAALIHKDRLNRHPEDYPPRIRELIEEGLNVPAVDYLHARKMSGKIRNEFNRSVTALVIPATPGAPPDTSSTGNAKYNSPWSFLGAPVVSMPVAYDRDGMPILRSTCELLFGFGVAETGKIIRRIERLYSSPAATNSPMTPFSDLLDILFEDNHLIGLNKPAGWPTTHFDGTEETVDRLVKAYLKEKHQKPGNVFLGVVHRLDKLTSGALLFARTSKAASRLSEQFRDGAAEKVYWAVVEPTEVDGRKPRELPDAGTLIDHLFHDEVEKRVRKVPTDFPCAKPARLHYAVKAREGGKLLLEIRPQTGRKHQLRVQLASRGYPILGDRKYGSAESYGSFIALHARSLTVIHPTQNEPITLKAVVPKNWKGRFAKLLN